jgi:GDP-4-dehydro-6-deoxy-D-mannose reductase
MTILITGATGFSGTQLSKILPRDELLLTSRSDMQGKKDLCNHVCLNLLDESSVEQLIRLEKPSEIYHLAGSFSNQYEKDFNLNVTATKHILNAVRNHSNLSRVLLIGSAAEYGLISSEQCPVYETAVLAPCNVYGLTKIYQKYLMDYYVNSFDLDVVMARPFNLYGKGISEKLFIGKVYSEIKNLKSGLNEKISLGNLNSERDYISIEETVRHYVRIMKCGQKGEVYNVGTGKPIKTGDILKRILKEEGVDAGAVISNQRDAQANDSDKIYANISKLKGLYDE